MRRKDGFSPTRWRTGAFCELLSIHRTLKQESRTLETFEAVEATDAEAARELYPLAQPALVKTEAYKTCGRYIDGPRDFEQARSSFERAVTLSTDPRFGRSMLSYGKNEFRDGVTTLVALLVLNERKEEAEVVASAARGSGTIQRSPCSSTGLSEAKSYPRVEALRNGPENTAVTVRFEDSRP